ncbi:hypothetical protein [Methylorubrum aminovorans]|uniref:hypothetical protein n=1 Tax=Methylorubrum aminovorans TaxID=269069 RepID=UPI003C2EEB85
MPIYTVELQGHDGSGVVTFYAASDAFNTEPGDVPGNQHFHPSLETPANFERALFSAGATTGEASIGFGEIVLANAHGRYDAWPDIAFDGRPCIVKTITTDPVSGAPLWSYKDAPVLLRGTVESVDLTDAFSTVRLRLYDRLADLDQPLQTARYGGTTAAGGQGADGTADMKDTPKPRVYGRKSNVVPVDVNPFDLIRQVSDRACTSIAVFDGGLALTNAGDFADVSALTAAALAPGQYATALSLGVFRLGGVPASIVTADVVATGGASAAAIARQMLLDAGFAPTELDGPSFDALQAKNGAPCGLILGGDESVLGAVTRALRSIGGWIVPDGIGVFSVGRLELPTGEPIATFQEWQCRGEIERLAPSDSNRGVPAYRVVVRYGQLGRAQGDNEVAGAVSAARRAALALEWRQAAAENAAVKSRFLQAQEISFDTCLVNAADAQAEAQRLLAIYSVRRDVWRIRVDMAGLDYRVDGGIGEPFAMQIGLGRTVSLSIARFLNPARNFVVIGRTEDCVNDRIQFDLWG